MDSFAKADRVSPETMRDRIHIYKACLLEEILSGRGCAGNFRAATACELKIDRRLHFDRY